MSEDIDFAPTTDGSETGPSAPPPEAAPPRSEALKKRVVKLGKGVMDVLSIYAHYTTGGLYNALPPSDEIAPEPPPPDPEPIRVGIWKSQGPLGQDNPPAEIVEEIEHKDGKTYYKLRDPEDHSRYWYAPADEVEVSSEGPDGSDGETLAEDTDTIEEDTRASLDEPSRVEEYLRSKEVDTATIEQVQRILEMGQPELVKEHLAAVGVEPENLEHVAHILKPLHIYLKRLQELGMPSDKDGEASYFLHEEKGRLRLKHLENLVGGKADAIRLLMRTHQSELLVKELKALGYDDDKISRVAATPRLNKTRLTKEALTRLGLDDRLIRDVELIVAVSEIPPDIAERARVAGLSLEDLAKAREAFRRAGWGETCDYLELAKTDPGARALLRSHGIEIESTPETSEAKRGRLDNMTLKEINEKYPEEWEAERDRRVDQNRRQFFEMLEKFKDYLPLEDFPLPADVEVPPEERIPEDFPGAYGLWRRVVTENYARLLATEGGYQIVRREIKRVGGPPVVRRLGQKNMARKVLAGQQGRDREIGSDKDYGAFGLGREQYLANLRAMQELDTRAANIRRALDKFHRNRFIKDGQATPRRQLAEAVVEHRLKEVAYREGRLDLMPPHQIEVPTNVPEPYAEDEESGEGMV